MTCKLFGQLVFLNMICGLGGSPNYGLTHPIIGPSNNAPAAYNFWNWYASTTDWFIMNIFCKSCVFDAWGFKLSKLGCLVVAFTNYVSKCVCGGQILELIWINNWLVYYEHLMRQSDSFSAWGLNISKLRCLVVAFTDYVSKRACDMQLLDCYESTTDWFIM